MATFRGFPWKKVPVSCHSSSYDVIVLRCNSAMKIYILAQILGGVVGAAVVYANYFHAIDIVEGGRDVRTLVTAGLFSTYTVSDFTL